VAETKKGPWKKRVMWVALICLSALFIIATCDGGNSSLPDEKFGAELREHGWEGRILEGPSRGIAAVHTKNCRIVMQWEESTGLAESVYRTFSFAPTNRPELIKPVTELPEDLRAELRQPNITRSLMDTFIEGWSDEIGCGP
jgi:hypothetical protein